MSNNSSIVDFSAIEKFVGKNVDAQVKIFGKFVDSCPEIKTDIIQAGKSNNADEVRANAHKLKSSARAVGANKLADLCLELESAGKTADWDKIKTLTPEVANTTDETCNVIKGHIKS